MSERIEYLKMLQGVITRMANYSFQVRNWSLGTMGVLWGLTEKAGYSWPMFIAVSTLICLFWRLSAFYLQKERMFRKIYDDVVKSPVTKNPDTQAIRPLFSITPTDEDEKQAGSVCVVMRSETLSRFYGILLLINAVLMLPVLMGNICSNSTKSIEGDRESTNYTENVSSQNQKHHWVK